MSKGCHRQVTIPAYLLRPSLLRHWAALVTFGNRVRAGLTSLEEGCPSLPCREGSEGIHTSQCLPGTLAQNKLG